MRISLNCFEVVIDREEWWIDILRITFGYFIPSFSLFSIYKSNDMFDGGVKYWEMDALGYRFVKHYIKKWLKLPREF